jgi:predicted acetyltransferase
MSLLALEEPSVGRIDSYRALVREFLVRGERPVPFVLDWPNADAAAFVERCAASARGEGLPEGFVPHSTFWIVEDGRDVIGVSNLRHRLTDSLRVEGGHIGYGVRTFGAPAWRRLRAPAPDARARARARHQEALVTCASTNEASIRTILRKRRPLPGRDVRGGRGEAVQRYWVPAAATPSSLLPPSSPAPPASP